MCWIITIVSVQTALKRPRELPPLNAALLSSIAMFSHVSLLNPSTRKTQKFKPWGLPYSEAITLKIVSAEWLKRFRAGKVIAKLSLVILWY